MKKNNFKQYVESLILYLYDICQGAEEEFLSIIKKLKNGQIKLRKKERREE